MPNHKIQPDNTVLHILFPKQAKAEQERKQHAALVLATFDRMTHENNRERLEKKAEVERKARNQI